MSSADNLLRLDVLSGSNLFDTLIVFLKEFFEEKNLQTTKEHAKLPSRQLLFSEEPRSIKA